MSFWPFFYDLPTPAITCALIRARRAWISRLP